MNNTADLTFRTKTGTCPITSEQIILTREGARGAFAQWALGDLEAKLREFMDYYNTTMAHPFAWTYTGKPTQQKRRPTFVSPHRRVHLSKSRRLAEPLASCTAV